MSRTQWFVLGALLVATLAFADQSPTSLACQSNAKAWRDYGFMEARWEGVIGDERYPFGSATTALPREGMPLREKVFSALHTDTPIIRSITPASGPLPADSVEFLGKVLLRSSSELYVTWSNRTNKVWLAVIDVRHRKAVVTQTFVGVTSVGGELETLDCK